MEENMNFENISKTDGEVSQSYLTFKFE